MSDLRYKRNALDALILFIITIITWFQLQLAVSIFEQILSKNVLIELREECIIFLKGTWFCSGSVFTYILSSSYFFFLKNTISCLGLYTHKYIYKSSYYVKLSKGICFDLWSYIFSGQPHVMPILVQNF